MAEMTQRGTNVFFTSDNFGSSLLPLVIPHSMQVSLPAVMSAHFAGPVLLFVLGHKVYIYDYEAEVWSAATGIRHPVSHISGENCCYSENSFCLDISSSVFAYLHGERLSKANIYYSKNMGLKFEKFTFVHKTGLLIIDGKKAKFAYSDPPLDRSFGLPFDYNGTLDVLVAPGQKGILVLWCDHSLQVSRNAGQLVNTVTMNFGPQVLHHSIFEAGLAIHSIAANENELAFLTQQNGMYYGNLGALTSSVIQVSDENVWSPHAALMFTNPGMLEILTPVPDASHPAFDFTKCPVMLQELFMSPHLHLDSCTIEVLHSDFHNKMYVIDMNSELQLTAKLIPHMHKLPIPLVTVSNPHSLGVLATISEQDYTLNGNVRYNLTIDLKQQHHLGRAEPTFTTSIERPMVSTITLDVANKELTCMDIQPLAAVLEIDISACSRGVLSPVTLQDNYTYVLSKETYDPNFHGQEATEDRKVLYPYEKLGCPLLVYCYTPWKPVIELWIDGKFKEVITTEFVLLEVNGLFTYTYTLSAHTALCQSQPQNWTNIMASTGYTNPFSWNRENYVSCHKADTRYPLKWPGVTYEILGGPTDNKVIFDHYNGLYIFWISIVDPHYSYCHLETTFSIYVYGAFPAQIKGMEPITVMILLTVLLSIWLTYAVPKMSCIKRHRGLRDNPCGRWKPPTSVSQSVIEHKDSDYQGPAGNASLPHTDSLYSQVFQRTASREEVRA
ncbi:cation channel sperm-associated auxiliary subunit delta [Rhynchocyon petersi]